MMKILMFTIKVLGVLSCLLLVIVWSFAIFCFVSVSCSQLFLILHFIWGQTPKATVEVKDLGVEISKDGGTKPCVLVKLQLVPVVVHLGDPRISFDQSSSFCNAESFTAGQTCFASIEKASAPFFCEEFHLSSEFGHDRLVFFIFYYVFPQRDLRNNDFFLVFFPSDFCSSKEALVLTFFPCTRVVC